MFVLWNMFQINILIIVVGNPFLYIQLVRIRTQNVSSLLTLEKAIESFDLANKWCSCRMGFPFFGTSFYIETCCSRFSERWNDSRVSNLMTKRRNRFILIKNLERYAFFCRSRTFLRLKVEVPEWPISYLGAGACGVVPGCSSFPFPFPLPSFPQGRSPRWSSRPTRDPASAPWVPWFQRFLAEDSSGANVGDEILRSGHTIS